MRPDSAVLAAARSAGFSAYSVIRRGRAEYYGRFACHIAGRRARALSRATAGHELFDAQGHGSGGHKVFGREETGETKRNTRVGHARLLDYWHEHDQKRATFRGRLCAGQMAIAHTASN